MSNGEQRFVDAARRSLDARGERLSPAIAAQLREARAMALAGGRRGTQQHWWQAAAIAAAVVLVVALVWFEQPVQSPSLSLAQAPLDNGGDLELLLSKDDPEFYRDLEFYYWLAQEQGNAG